MRDLENKNLHMNQIQTEQFKNKLDNLGKFTVNKKEFTSEEIINWLAECVTTFSEIGVSQIIIDDFLKFFSLKREKTKYKKSFYKDGIITIQSFGPFKEKIEKIGPDYSLGSENMINAFVLTNQYEVSNNFYYAKIAFSAAKNILKQTTDGEKLVPHWLQNTFKESEEYSHLNSSLKLIEENYRDKNTSGLITNAITLLDTILNIDSELNKKGRLGGKLNSLIENEKKRKTFGVSTDLVKALNNGRIIRNEGIIHKDVPIKYNIPFIIVGRG